MMLDLKTRPTLPNVMRAAQMPADDDFAKLAGGVRLFLKRNYKLAILLTVLGALAGVGYLKIVQPSYTAAAIIEVANREGKYLQQQATLTDLPADIGRYTTVAKSWAIAAKPISRAENKRPVT